LEHHDIDTLERTLKARSQRRNELLLRLKSADDQYAVIDARQSVLSDSRTHLFGIGRRPEFLGSLDASDVNRHSVLSRDSDGESLVGIHPAKPANSVLLPLKYYAEENFPEPKQSNVNGGQSFPVGFARGGQFFCLERLLELCGQATYSREALANHFYHHRSNFRLIDSDRTICSNCQKDNDAGNAPCRHCEETISELWMYGTFSGYGFEPDQYLEQKIPPVKPATHIRGRHLSN
jgi:hypothetical protein